MVEWKSCVEIDRIEDLEIGLALRMFCKMSTSNKFYDELYIQEKITYEIDN